MKACPAAVTCRWHNRVAGLLRAGQVEQIRADKDVLLVLLGRAWRLCNCGLARRVRAVL
jgi:hypothetical protein